MEFKSSTGFGRGIGIFEKASIRVMLFDWLGHCKIYLLLVGLCEARIASVAELCFFCERNLE